MDKFQRGCLKMKTKIPFLPLSNLFITFYSRLEISNGFLVMKITFISQCLFILRFLQKIILLWINEVSNYTSNTISTFDLTMSG